MSWSDDDWGKPIFPTRFGSPQGHATERKMLDAVGGFDGIRTKIRTNPDGSQTMLRTKGGMPRFITSEVTKEEIKVSVLFGSAFFANPTSALYQNGYIHPDAPGTAGVHHEWSDFHTTPIDQPAAYPASAPVLSPDHLMGDTHGTSTWWGDVELNGKKLVIGWHWGNMRNGNFAVATTSAQIYSHYYQWTSLPSHNDFVNFNTCVPRAFSLFIGRFLRIQLDSLVIDSAALRAVPGGYSMYVISEAKLYVSTGWERVFSTSGGRTVVKQTIDATTLASLKTFTLVGDINPPAPYHTWFIKQAMFFNHAGSKFVVLADATGDDTGTKTTLFEFSVDTLVGTEKATSKHFKIDPVGTTDGVTTASFSSGEGWRKERILAADYLFDTGELVWITGTDEFIGGALEASINPISYSGTYPGAVTKTGNKSLTQYGSFYSVEIRHSKYGLLRREVLSDMTSSVEFTHASSVSGTVMVNAYGDILSGTFDYDSYDETFSVPPVGGVEISIQNGDVRNGTFVIDVKYAEQQTSGWTISTESWEGPTPTGSTTSTRSGSTGALRELKKRLIFAFNKYVRQQNCRMSELTGTTPASTNTYSGGRVTSLGTVNLIPGTGALTDVTQFNTTTVKGNWVTGPYAYPSSEPFTFVSVDPYSRVAYVCAQASTSYLDQMRYEAFLVRDSGGNPVEKTVPLQKYVPGSLGMLASPVFYSEEYSV